MQLIRPRRTRKKRRKTGQYLRNNKKKNLSLRTKRYAWVFAG